MPYSDSNDSPESRLTIYCMRCSLSDHKTETCVWIDHTCDYCGEVGHAKTLHLVKNQHMRFELLLLYGKPFKHFVDGN